MLPVLSATAATLSGAHSQVVLKLERDVHVGRLGNNPVLPSQHLHNLDSSCCSLVLLKSIERTCAI